MGSCLVLDPCLRDVAPLAYMNDVIEAYKEIYEAAKLLEAQGWDVEVDCFDGPHVVCRHQDAATEEEMSKLLKDKNIVLDPKYAYFEDLDDLNGDILSEGFATDDDDCGSGGCGFCGCHE